jgi:hypothetical protein
VSNSSRREASAADDDGTRIARYVEAHPDSFAGHWYDHEAGLHLVAFTAHLDAHRANLAALVNEPERLGVVSARYSYRQLEQVMAQIVPHMGEWSITICGPDPRRNVIRVGVSAERVEFIRARLEHAYGDRVWVIEHGPVWLV